MSRRGTSKDGTLFICDVNGPKIQVRASGHTEQCTTRKGCHGSYPCPAGLFDESNRNNIGAAPFHKLTIPFKRVTIQIYIYIYKDENKNHILLIK